MKKRFLSAVLALAMVLTLLPVSVFAADPPKPTSYYYFANGAKFPSGKGSDGKTNTDETNGAGWYFRENNTGADKNTYAYIYTQKTLTNEVLAASAIPSSGGTGNLYDNLNDAILASQSSITLLTSSNSLIPTNVKSGSLNINLNGENLTVSNNPTTAVTTKTPNGNNFSQLNITDSSTGTKGEVTGTLGIIGKNFTLNVTNTSKAVNTGLAVTLNNVDEDYGASPKQSYTLSVTVDNAKIGAITTKNAKGNITVRNAGTAGNITLGNNDDVTDDLLKANTRTGGTVTVNNATVGNVTLAGNARLTAEQRATVGGVKLYGGAKVNNEADKTKTPTWGGSTVDIKGGSTVTGITQDATDEIGHTITVDNTNIGNSSIKLDGKGASTVNVQNGSIVGTASVGVYMKYGTLNVKDSTVGTVSASTGPVEEGTLSINIGTANSKTDKPVVNNFAFTGVGKPSITVHNGTVGKIDLTKCVLTFNGGTIIGQQLTKNELSDTLDKGYEIRVGGYNANDAKYTYTADFQDLIDAYRENNSVVIHPVGDTEQTNAVTFKWFGTKVGNTNDETVLVKMYISSTGFVTLPKVVNKQTVDYWYIDDSKEGVASGTIQPVTKNMVITAQRVQDSTNTITKISAIDKNSNSPIGCTVSGNTIRLSGMLGIKSNAGSIDLIIEIDNKANEARTVNIGWEPNSKTLVVRPITGLTGVTKVNNTTIKIYDTEYTIVDGGLGQEKNDVTIKTDTATNAVVTTANAGLGGVNDALGKILKTALETSTADFSKATGIQTALNALVNGMSPSSVINSAANSQLQYMKIDNPNTKTTAADLAKQYKYVQVTPYLEISATNYKPTSGNPEITLNITPKYRYKVSNSNTFAANSFAMTTTKNADGTYKEWEQTGSLTATDCGPVTIALKMPQVQGLNFSGTSWAHHNGFVYELTWTSGSAKFTTLNGFSPYTINSVAPKYSITRDSKPVYFETLQNAVDEVKNDETIIVSENFNGSINLTGQARKFTIKSSDPKNITVYLTAVNGASATFDPKKLGDEYTVQLTKDNIVTVNGVTISATAVTGGSGSLSATSVKPGETVTYTPRPSAGYAVSSVAVKTNTGATVNVTANANGTYSFVVPSGVTSVTVTPTFTKTTSNPKLLPFTDVQDDKLWYYDGVAYCYLTEVNGVKLLQGYSTSVFGVGRPLSRADVAQMLYNLAGRPAAPAVQYPFYDVPKTHWAYDAINWAARNGLAEGYGNGNYGPDDPVLRDELVVFLWRYAKKQTGTANLNAYTDGSKVPTWAQAAMRWAASGILSGTNGVSLGNTLSPRTAAYREQVAVTVMNFHRLYG